MKLYRFALSIWITLASGLSFLLGWVILAHSPKPIQSVPVQSVQPAALSQTVLPTLTPLQLQGGSGNSFQNFQVQIPSTSLNSAPPPAPAPIFRTSGS